METERLHKVMAARGVASRRACEKLIEAGRVSVDGKTVTKLGTKVPPDADIRVDGRPTTVARPEYYMLHKPSGVVTTLSDDRNRRCVGDILAKLRTRVYPVGRLDHDSEGLVLLTNDGELTNILTHPRFEIKKTYRVRVRGRMEKEALGKLSAGIRLREGVAAAKVRVLKRTRSTTELLMTTRTGYNRQIRRMCAAVGHQVTRLRRVEFGPLSLRGVAKGRFRRLKYEEVDALRRLARPRDEAQDNSKKSGGRRHDNE